MITPKSDILHGWKEIAAYLDRDVRTVRRWEKQRHLPVRRTPGEGRSNVYAIVADLNQWLLCSPETSEIEEAVEVQEIDTPMAEERRPMRFGFTMAATMAGLGILGCFLFVYTAFARGDLAAGSRRAEPYRSRVSGVDELYLRGVYLYEQRTPKSLTEAHEALQQVVRKDPADAPAWSALASTTIMLEQFGMLGRTQAFDEIRTTAKQALLLDDSLAEAHASLGFIQFFGESRPQEAEKEFQRALALDPKNVAAHHRYGIMLVEEGRFAEALDQLNLAQHLDPASTAILASRAVALGFTGRRDEAVRLLLPVAEAQPGNPVVHARLATLAAMRPRNLPLYLEQRRQLSAVVSNPESFSYVQLQQVLQVSGEAAMWRDLLARVYDDSAHGDFMDIAIAQAQLGQKDAAFATLERAQHYEPLTMLGLKAMPLLQSLQDDPRFNLLLAEQGMPSRP